MTLMTQANIGPYTEQVPRVRINSVVKAVQLLDFLAIQQAGRTAREIAAHVGIPRPTAYHLLDTLVDEGLLAKDFQRRYHLGPKIAILSHAMAQGLAAPEYLNESLRTLAERTAETAFVSGWRHDDAVILAVVESRQPVRVGGLTPGLSGWLHARSSGKVFLAFLDESVAERYVETHGLPARTSATITSADALRKELKKIRKAGYAIDRGEYNEGSSSVAAPILMNGLPVAVIGVAAPGARFDQHEKELREAVITVAIAGIDGRVRQAR